MPCVRNRVAQAWRKSWKRFRGSCSRPAGTWKYVFANQLLAREYERGVDVSIGGSHRLTGKSDERGQRDIVTAILGAHVNPIVWLQFDSAPNPLILATCVFNRFANNQ
jgi:hypothetical protein